MGDEGWASLTPALQAQVAAAPVVIGGRRHLGLLPDVAGQDRRPWPSPLRAGLPALLAETGCDLVVLASGDPLRSGVATTLIDLLGPDRVRVHPWLSSDSLARARMGWAAEDVDVVSLVGRPLERIHRHLDPGARVVALCPDGAAPARLAALVADAGHETARLTAWWHLGGADEGHRAARAAEWGSEATPDLVVLCVEVGRDRPAGPDVGPAPGRASSAFEHDGLITKRDVRASALAHLRPTRGGVLWDLGAGSGAVALEWCLAAPQARAVALERDGGRAEVIARNAARLGAADHVEVRVADVGDDTAYANLPAPDAVFVGGGLTEATLQRALTALRPGGRLVAHAVTIESERLLVDAHAAHGGDLTRIAVEHAEPLGRFTGWRPARHVVQWSVQLTGPVADRTADPAGAHADVHSDAQTDRHPADRPGDEGERP